MKNIKTKNAPQNVSGVVISYRGSNPPRNKIFGVIMGTLLSYVITLAISLGGLFTFTTMFEIPFNSTIFSAVSAFYALALMVVFQLPKKAVGFTMLGTLVAFVTTAIVFLNQIVSGIVYIKDFISIGIAKAMFWRKPELSYVFDDTMKVATTIVLCLLSILLITGVSYFTIRKISFFVPFILSFSLFEIGAAYGCVPSHFAFSFLLAGWLGLFSMHLSVWVKKIRKRRGNKKKSKTTTAKRKQHLIAGVAVLVALITFLTFNFGNYLIVTAGYDRPEYIKELRAKFKKNLSKSIEYIWYDDDGSLFDGQLYLLDDRNIKERKYLTVQMPYKKQSYLRGFVGGTYTGDAWEPVATNNTLEAAYKSSGYYPQNMQGELLKELAKTNKTVKHSAATVTIDVLRQEKDYAYTTYTTLLDNNFKLSGDTSIAPSNKSEYSYTAYLHDSNIAEIKNSPLYNKKEFSSIWKQYTKFVNANYTTYPNDMDEIKEIVNCIVNGTGCGYKGMGKSSSDLETADRIREYVSKNIAYSLEVDTLPENTDFVKWLLNDTKKGYSAHYATALAIMLRMAGIPCRYIEGYVITLEDYMNSKKLNGDYCLINVTDHNAHAWIEIYDSTYGWIQVETTPGFFTGSLINNEESVQVDDSQMQTYPTGEEITPDDIGEQLPNDQEENYIYMEDSRPSAFSIIMKYVIIVIAAFSVLALIFMIILTVRRAIRLMTLNNAILKGKKSKRIAKIYKYYIRLLSFEHIENTEHMPYMQFAEYASNNSLYLKGDLHKKGMEVFLKYRFSNNQVTDDELTLIQNSVLEYSKNTVNKLKGKEKFNFMFLKNLG